MIVPMIITTCTALLTAAVVTLAPSPADGWMELFDGETLGGWTTTGGRYDGKAVWAVEEGAITGREGPGRAGGLIYTEAPYDDFEFECQAWVDYPFDSGVFVRMRPDQDGMQFTLDNRPGGETGALYSAGYFLHNPAGAALWKQEAWNHVRVRVAGNPMHCEMWVNGVKTTDHRLADGTRPLATSGLIGLQVHGGGNAPEGARAAFKEIRVRALPKGSGDYWTAGEDGLMTLTAAGARAGWESLFNGRDTTGWEAHGDGRGYRATDGVLEFLVEGGSPQLVTKRDFQDFQLRLDFKLARMANSGLFLRATRDGSNPAYSGREVQILDDHNWEADTNSKLKPWQFTGSLYGAAAPAQKALKPNGEWNTLCVTLDGPRMVTVLNGKILYDLDTEGLTPEQGAAFAERAAAGFIGLQRHAPGGLEGDAYAWFRNLYVRELR